MESLIQYLPWIQIFLSVLLTALVLIQQSDATLGSAFGGGMSESISRTRRGADRVVFILTIVTAILFILSTIAAHITR